MLGNGTSPRHARRAMGLLSAIRGFFTHPVEAEPQPIAKADDVPKMPATPVTEPVGSSGPAAYGGHVSTEERAADMVGAARYRTYADHVRLVTAFGAAMRAFLVAASAPGWTVKPYKADDAEAPTPEDEARAAWLKRQLATLATPWEWHVASGCLATCYGSAYATWTARRQSAPAAGARLGLADLTWIPLGTIDRWDLDPQGRLLGFAQRDPQTAAEVPIGRERLLHVRDLPTTNHPAGDGALRTVAEAGRSIIALSKLLKKGFEKDVNGVPIVWGPLAEKKALIGKIPEGGTKVYTAADFARDVAPMFDFVDADKRKDGGLVFDAAPYTDVEGNPSGSRKYDAKVLSASSSSHAQIMDRINDEIWYGLAALGCEWMAMGRANGTQAMHVSKAAMFAMVVSSSLTRFAGAFTRDVVRSLWILNGWDPANPSDPQNLPTLEWDALELSDVASVVNAIAQALSAGGVEPGRADDVIDAVLSNMGLPRLRPMDDPAVLGAREAAAAAVRPQPIDPEDPPEVAPDDEPMPPEED